MCETNFWGWTVDRIKWICELWCKNSILDFVHRRYRLKLGVGWSQFKTLITKKEIYPVLMILSKLRCVHKCLNMLCYRSDFYLQSTQSSMLRNTSLYKSSFRKIPSGNYERKGNGYLLYYKKHCSMGYLAVYNDFGFSCSKWWSTYCCIYIENALGLKASNFA